jgi:hypothetical protein
MTLKSMGLAATAIALLTSCDLLFAPLFTPNLPVPQPRLPVASVARWDYTEQGLRLVVVPDYAALPVQDGITKASVNLNRGGDILHVSVWATRGPANAGRPTEVTSEWFPLSPGTYRVVGDDGKPLTTIEARTPSSSP